MMTVAEQLEWDELGQHTYGARVRAVLYEGARSCPASGHHHAGCVRLPDHKGWCEGPGFDDWGPRYVTWRRKGAVDGDPVPVGRRMS